VNIPNILTRQHNVGVKLGALRILIGSIMFYVSMANFAMISAMAYNTTLRAAIQTHFPWFSFPIFISLMVVFVLAAIIMEHKFVVPSVTSYSNAQWYKHKNPAREDLEKILRKLDELEAKIK